MQLLRDQQMANTLLCPDNLGLFRTEISLRRCTYARFPTIVADSLGQCRTLQDTIFSYQGVTTEPENGIVLLATNTFCYHYDERLV